MSARILLVDDDPVAQDLVKRILESRGYAVDAVGDGMSGIKLLNQNHYDLALIDYHLPELDGFVSTRMMRDLTAERPDQPKFAAITADRQGLATRSGSANVFDDVLAKPIDPHALLAFVAKMLAVSTQTGTAQAAAAFLQMPQHELGRAAAAAFWRGRGLPGAPKAAILPTPRAEQIAALSLCFTMCEPADADIVLLLDQAGLDDLARLRCGNPALLAPAFDAGTDPSGGAEAAFRVAEPQSWTQVAEIIKGFALRREELFDRSAQAFGSDGRLLAYLYLANRSIVVTRAGNAAARVSNAGGFPEQMVLRTLQSLAARGLVTQCLHRPNGPTGSDARRRPDEKMIESYQVSPRGIVALTFRSGGLESAFGIDASAPASGSTPEPRSGAAPAPLSVLVAIESSLNRDITKSMLESAGHAVDTFPTVEQAMAAAQRTTYDLVLLDAPMISGAGQLAAALVRAVRGPMRDVSIIAFSANARPDVVAELQMAGVGKVLPRPFRRADLLAAVELLAPARHASTSNTDVQTVAKFDREVYDGLLDFMEPPSRARLLDDFRQQIAIAFTETTMTLGNARALASVAHAMISAAGMLGFGGLSEACRSFCDRLRSSDEVPDLGALRIVSVATLRCIAEVAAASQPATAAA